MKKKPSKRRWKARIMLGQKVPWSIVVNYNLTKFCNYERQYDTMMAYRLPLERQRNVEIRYEN